MKKAGFSGLFLLLRMSVTGPFLRMYSVRMPFPAFGLRSSRDVCEFRLSTVVRKRTADAAGMFRGRIPCVNHCIHKE